MSTHDGLFASIVATRPVGLLAAKGTAGAVSAHAVPLKYHFVMPGVPWSPIVYITL